jgi:alkylation response protein AidB-like acyl-CoA dehydrogenase
VVVTPSGQDVALNGSVFFVQDAMKADVLIVRAGGLYAVSCDALGVKIISDSIVDLTRDQAHVEFNNVTATLLTENGDAALKQAEPALLTLLAADMVGAAEWQLQTTVEYARTRVQFDRPIGFFQAVKHPLVDLMLMVDQARALVYAAACAIDHEPESADLSNSNKYAHMAKASASDLASYASKKSVQLHGGIGFTWECFIHIYAKRQKHSQTLWGDAMFHRARLANVLL